MGKNWQRFKRLLLDWWYQKIISLFPKDYDILVLYPEQIENIEKAVEIFQRFQTDDPEKWSMIAVQIKDLEKKNDMITKEINVKLDKTFITPFERAHISKLAGGIDDIIDQLEKATNRIFIFKIPRDPKMFEYLQEFSGYLHQALKELKEAVNLLKEIKSHSVRIQIHCENIDHIEENMDMAYRRSLAELAATGNVLKIVLWKEIFEAMEASLDKCHDVSRIIQRILSDEGV